MAIFNILARNKSDFDYSECYNEIRSLSQKYIYIFPLVSPDGIYFEGLGVTAGAKDLRYKQDLKKELKLLLEWLFNKGFTVKELYTGKELTNSNYTTVFSYFW